MDLQSTLYFATHAHRVVEVFQKIMKTLYDIHFSNAEARLLEPNPNCPDSDILTIR